MSSLLPRTLARFLTPALFVVGTLAGCSPLPPPTLRGAPIASPPVARTPRARIALAPVVDARPVEERKGLGPGTKLFVFFGVGMHVEIEGNVVTSDRDTSTDAPGELRDLAATWLATSQVARVVDASEAHDFELAVEIEHLYATRFLSLESTTIFLGGKHQHARAGDADVESHALYGDVTLHASLVDVRGGARRVVWEEHVSGYSENPPPIPALDLTRSTVQAAVGDALDTLDQRLGAALDRLAVGPSGATEPVADAASLPDAFVIERMSVLRDFLERVTIDTATGRVRQHAIVDAPDRYASRPGDWVLSRVDARGRWMDATRYGAFARSLAGRFDLRVVDDAAHVHFFGARAIDPR